MNLVWRIFVLLILVVACVWVYREYQDTKQDTPGHMVWKRGQPTPQAKAAFDRRNSGDDDADSGRTATDTSSAAAYPSSSTKAAASVPVSGQPAADSRATSPAATQPIFSQPAAPQTVASQTAGIMPRSDSQPPNPPNGEAYRGTGVYELYRQGNLTYRMDTATGRTCIAFATVEEWRKPVVMHNGCGRIG